MTRHGNIPLIKRHLDHSARPFTSSMSPYSCSTKSSVFFLSHIYLSESQHAASRNPWCKQQSSQCWIKTAVLSCGRTPAKQQQGRFEHNHLSLKISHLLNGCQYSRSLNEIQQLGMHNRLLRPQRHVNWIFKRLPSRKNTCHISTLCRISYKILAEDTPLLIHGLSSTYCD